MTDFQIDVTKLSYDWPHHVDISKEKDFETKIKPFILAKLEDLKTLDQKREAYVRDNLPDDYTMTYRFYEHSLNAADDMKKTASHLHLPGNIQDALYWAMLAHDIGKIHLPVALWDMVEKPEDEIKAKRRTHIDLGYEMFQDTFSDYDTPFTNLTRDIILYHHEMMDGSGPKDKTGYDLSVGVRLACIIESFDGYATPRHHFGDRDVSTDGVIKRMRDEKGQSHYDLSLLDAFVSMKNSEAKKAKAQ